MLLTSLPLLNNDTNFHSPMSGPILLPLYTLQTSVQEIWRHKSFNQWFGYGINYHPSPLLGLALQHPNKSKRPFGPRARSKFPILPRLSLPLSNTCRAIPRSRAALHLRFIVTMPLQDEIHRLILKGTMLYLRSNTRT